MHAGNGQVNIKNTIEYFSYLILKMMVLFVVFDLMDIHADHLQEDIGDQGDGQAKQPSMR